MFFAHFVKSALFSSSQLITSATNTISSFKILRSFSQVNPSGLLQPMLPGTNCLSLNSVRHRKKAPRDYFPRASEQKRLKQAGWRVRMLTPSGRRILMRRILKGLTVLSH